MHESLHHFVAQSAWSDEQMLREVRSCVLPAMPEGVPSGAGLAELNLILQR